MEEEQPPAESKCSPSHQPAEAATYSTALGELEQTDATEKIELQHTNDFSKVPSPTTTTTSTISNPVIVSKPVRRGMVECPVCGDTFTRSFLLRKHRAEQCGIKCMHCDAIIPEPKMEKHLWTFHGLPAGLKRTGDSATGQVTKTFVLCDKTPKRQEARFHQLSGVVTEGYTCTVRSVSDETNANRSTGDGHVQQELKVTSIKVLTDAKVQPLPVSSKKKMEEIQAVTASRVRSRDRVDGQQVSASNHVMLAVVNNGATSPDHTYGQSESNTIALIKQSQLAQAANSPKAALAATSTAGSSDPVRRSPIKNEPSDGFQSDDTEDLDDATVPTTDNVSAGNPSRQQIRAGRKTHLCCGQRFGSSTELRRHVLTHGSKTSPRSIDETQRRSNKRPQYQRVDLSTKRRTKNSNNNSQRSQQAPMKAAAASKAAGDDVGQCMLKCLCGTPYKTQRSLDKHIDRCPWAARGSGQSTSKRRHCSPAENSGARLSAIVGVETTTTTTTTTAGGAKDVGIFVVRRAGANDDTTYECGVGGTPSMAVEPLLAAPIVTSKPGEKIKCNACKLLFEKPEAAERHRALVHTLRPKMFRHSAAMFGGGQRRNLIVTGLRGAPPPKDTPSLPCRFCPKTFRTKQTLLTHCSKYHAQNVLLTA